MDRIPIKQIDEGFDTCKNLHYYEMWVQFISPCSLDYWIHYFFIGPRSLQLAKSLKIQWNHLAYKGIFCCSRPHWNKTPSNYTKKFQQDVSKVPMWLMQEPLGLPDCANLLVSRCHIGQHLKVQGLGSTQTHTHKHTMLKVIKSCVQDSEFCFYLLKLFYVVVLYS
jgi:hypothetical protein